MKKIAFIIDTIESPTAGTEKQLLLLIRNLDRSRFEPNLFVLRSSPWLEENFNLCPLHVLEFRSFGRISSYRGLIGFARTLGRERYSCVQTYFIDANIVGIVGAFLGGVRNVVSSRRDQGYWHTKAKVLLLRILNHGVTTFVANCHATARWAQGAEGISGERIRVIYNGAEIECYGRRSSQKTAWREALLFPAEAIVIGIVANLRPVKRIDVFLQAASILRRTVSEVRFVVVGDGEQRRMLEDMAEQLGISDRTIFLGGRQDVPDVLPLFDVGVLSSDSESFSNSIIEYMAAGLPVVATEVGGAGEMIADGINGYLVPPSEPAVLADRILELLKGKDLERIGRQNRDKARTLFSCAAMVEAFEKLYSGEAGA